MKPEITNQEPHINLLNRVEIAFIDLLIVFADKLIPERLKFFLGVASPMFVADPAKKDSFQTSPSPEQQVSTPQSIPPRPAPSR